MDVVHMFLGLGLGYVVFGGVVIALIAARTARIESGEIPVEPNEKNIYDFGG